MEKMQIVVRDFEELKELFPAWSVVYVRIKDTAFPSEQWTDATSSVLVMWMNAAYRMVCGITNEILLPFMDGEYSIKMVLFSEEVALVSCIAPNNISVINTQVGLKYFCRQMIAAASKLTRHYSNSIQSEQILEVCATAEKLRAALRTE